MKRVIRSMYYQISIKHKWLLFVIILMIYPMFFIGYIGYKNYESAFTNQAVTNIEHEAWLVTELIKEELDEIESVIKQVQYDESVYEFCTYYHNMANTYEVKLDAPDEAAQIEAFRERMIGDYYLKNRIEGYMNSVILSRQDILLSAYQFVGQDSHGYIVTREKGSSHSEQATFRQNEIFSVFQELLSGEEKIAYYVDSNKDIYIGHKIFYRDTFAHIGNIIFEIDKDYIFRHYKKIVEGSKQGLYILNKEGQKLYEVGEVSEAQEQQVLAFLDQSFEEEVFYQIKEKNEMSIYQEIGANNLGLISCIFISLEVLLEEVRRMSFIVMLLCISTIPIFLLLAKQLYREIIHPVYKLSDKMHRIEKGEVGIVIEENREDEIGHMYQSFNKMSKQLQYLIEFVYKEQLALKNAELKSLQAQINPHFIYNTLEMINWKARMTEDEDLAEMVEALGGIIEIQIDRRDNHFIQVKEEVKYLRSYVFLMQKRFGDRVSFKIVVDEKILERQIPRLLIQPLIENAVTHGIANQDKATIDIAIKEVGENIIITIEDDGEGVEEEKLKRIQSELEEAEKSYIEDEGRGHIGILNVQRRIRLVYGESYGLEISSTKAIGTIVKLTFPKVREESNV